VTRVTITHSIVFNGKEYASVEEMPAEVRPLYEQAVAGLLPGGLWRRRASASPP
jgi:hypothetical protein